MNKYRKINLKQWAVEDRPREKLISRGSRFLSDAELIAILLGSGSNKETAVELGRRVLSSVNNDLNELGRKGLSFFTSFNGIGEAKGVTILAALELGRRKNELAPAVKKQITCSRDAAAFFTPLLQDLNHEEFWILILDRGNKVIDHYRISQGGISGTVIDVRIILKTALEKLASSIILCHNHPSGTMEASEADLKVTRKMLKAAGLMDISVLDHIIICQNNYLSMADEGILQ
ncbi:MAG: DNA repair protein RadC [Bacteroidales bacterium]|nr:DNA repair protein RadC [Bacteroidales bacterium]